MEKRVAAESLLPEAIIHNIQSFLNGKQAAKTTLLSKSWYAAWLTRPNLDFDQRDFRRNRCGLFLGFSKKSLQLFSEFSKKTLQRYQDLNLKIESFKLWMRGWEKDGYPLANELIVKAIRMGATDLSFELFPTTLLFVLPKEVLGSETLTRLSVTGCKIEDVKVSCSGLRFLCFRKVFLEGDMIWDLLSICPLIEELILPECKCFTIVHDFPYINNFTTRKRMLALSPACEIEKQNVTSGGRASLFELHKLKCLRLEKVKISTLFFGDFSTKFPCLKDLSVHYCFGFKEIQICSHSLESISFAQKMILKASFDCPRMRKFEFSGSSLPPSLSFGITSREWEWESDISLTCKSPSTLWFVNLNKLLQRLSLSTIYLSLDFQCDGKSFDYTGGIEVLPAVQILTMYADSSICPALLDGVFSSCRPMFIIQDWFPKPCEELIQKDSNDLLVLLCKTLVQEVSENFCIPNQTMAGLRELEEVNVEVFEKSRAEWQPLPWKTLLEACPEIERTVSFGLRWQQEPSYFEI